MTAEDERSILSMRPRYEGANIRTWIGFKHLYYLVEEAALQWFRERGFGPQRLYREHGLGLEIIDSSALLPALVEIDDEVVAETTPARSGWFSVKLRVARAGAEVVVLNGKVQVALIHEKDAPGAAPVPHRLAALAVPTVAAATTVRERRDQRVASGENAPSALAPPGSRAFLWSWRARYFHCHYSDRVQHSAYVRALEEIVDRFLDDRGISISRMLNERAWIPVVSRARVQMIADSHMEETIHSTFVVEEVLKGVAYDARMDCYVQRGDALVHTATARILHGYASSRGEAAGRLAALDETTLNALTGGGRA